MFWFGRHVAGERQVAGFQQHLEKCGIPADLQLVADARIVGSDRRELFVELFVARSRETTSTGRVSRTPDTVFFAVSLIWGSSAAYAEVDKATAETAVAKTNAELRPNAAHHGNTHFTRHPS